MYGGFHNKVGAVVRPSGLYNGHSHAQEFYRHDPVISVERYLDLLKNIQENTKRIKRRWHQKQVFQPWISNCIPRNIVGNNYLSLYEIPASSKTQGVAVHHPGKIEMLIQISFTVEGRAISHSYPLYNQFQLLQEKYRFKKWTSGTTNKQQLRSSHGSYDQAYPAVTINDLFPGVTVTINSPKFSLPDICISHPAAAVSHTQKINRSHDSFRAQYGRRTGCRVDTIRESLNSPCSASAILIDRNCAWA